MSKQQHDQEERWEDVFWKSRKYNERQKIKSGFYLHSFCPFCKKELTEEHDLSLEVVNQNGEVGILHLNPYLNSYEHKTDIKLSAGEEARDLRCPHCHQSLKVEGKKCGLGDARVAGFLIGVSNSKVPFYICMRVGCPWHAIDPDDESKIILDSSDEW